MNEKRLNRVFVDAYGATGFFKVKADSFGIDRVQFDFVSVDENNKAKTSISIFVNIYKAIALSQDILSGRIPKLIEESRGKAKDAGKQYPDAVWEDYGGVSLSAVKKRNLQPYASQGKAVSRILRLAAGSGQPYLLTATQAAGVEHQKGAITPEKGAPAQRVMVGFDAVKLKELAYGILTEWDAYIKSQYASGAYHSEWSPAAEQSEWGSPPPVRHVQLPTMADFEDLA